MKEELAKSIADVFCYFQKNASQSFALELTRLYYERLDNDYDWEDSGEIPVYDDEEHFPFSDQS